LYTYPENYRAYKVLIAAQYSGADVKVAGDFVFGETNKTEAFRKKFPLGKVRKKENLKNDQFQIRDNFCLMLLNANATAAII
jgi:elongation factor 1-gamma